MIRIFAISAAYLLAITQGHATPLDSLFSEANALQASRQFDQAYQLFEEVSTKALDQNLTELYIEARVEMARCSQFTSIVSRDAIGDIIMPAIKQIVGDSSLRHQAASAEAYQFLARYYWAVEGSYPSALEAYNQSLEICQQIGEGAREIKMASYNDMSHVYSNQELFTQALDMAQKALTLSHEIYGEDAVENGARYYSLGFTYYRSGNYDRAIKEIRRGISILESGGGPEMQIGLGYNNLSAVYVAQLDQEGALQSTQASSRILSKYLDPNHEAFGNINWDLAVMYADLQNYQEAEQYCRKAIDIFESRFGPGFAQLPDLYHHLGHCLDQTGEFEEAKNWHDAAKQLKMEIFGPDHIRAAESHRRLALHHLSAGQLSDAKSAIDMAFGIINTRAQKPLLTTAWLQDIQGMIASKQGNYLESAHHFDLAIATLVVDDTPGSVEVDQTFNPFFYTEFQEKKATALHYLFQENNDPVTLDQALAACRAAHQGVRKLRKSYRSTEAKIFLQKRARKIYDLMMELLWLQWQSNGSQDLMAEAWDISEQTKSLVLFEERMRHDLSRKTLPDVEYDSLTQIQLALEFQHKNLMDALQADDSVAAARYAQGYFTTSTNLAVFEDQLGKEFGSFARLQEDLSPLPLQEVQQKIPVETLLLSYYLADTSLFVFSIGSPEPNWIRIPLDSMFHQRLRTHLEEERNLEAILQNPGKMLAQRESSAAFLSDALLPAELREQLDEVQQLVVVPDKELLYLSFESLIYGDDRAYLIHRFATTYSYSGSLFVVHLAQARKLDLRELVAFAPSYPPIENLDPQDMAVTQLFRSNLGALPGAKKEVLQISKLFNGSCWVDSEATEQRFKSEAPNSGILHLALHGLLNKESPILSRLLFHQDSVSDGGLYAYEIYDLDLRANLAVLSACNTADGKLEVGEGIQSLSRAFAFAGIPNLIASLWRADDASSSQIMTNFYRLLQSGRSKDQALREAKIAFLNDQKTQTYRHPYFWASYVLIGENVSHVAPDHQVGLFLLFGLLLLILFYLFRRFT